MKKQCGELSLFGIVVFVWSAISFAQGPDTLWTRRYGGTNYECGKSVQQTSDGGYVVVGSTNSHGRREDVYLIKTDENGDVLWTRTFGGGNWDQGESVLQTSDGGYVIAGNLACGWSGVCDIYVIRTDAQGDTLWTRSYGGPLEEQTHSLAATDDGGCIIAGRKCTLSAEDPDVYLVRLDANGDTLWTKTYGGTASDGGCCVQQTHGGEIVIAGWTASFGAGGYDVWLLKTDAYGDTLWTRTYGGAGGDGGYSVQETSDGGYIIAGGTYSFGEGECDVYLIRTDANGDTLWTKTYGGIGSDVGLSIQQTSGGYIIAGWTDWDPFSVGDWDVYLVRTDEDGEILWTQTYGGRDEDIAWSVKQTSDGGYIVAGESGGDVYLLKTAPEVRIGEDESHGRAFFIAQSSPNPMIDRTSIKYQIIQPAHVRVTVHSLFGGQVKALIDAQKEAGHHTIVWDATDDAGRKVPSGTYFVRLEAHTGLGTGDYSATRKVCVVR